MVAKQNYRIHIEKSEPIFARDELDFDNSVSNLLLSVYRCPAYCRLSEQIENKAVIEKIINGVTLE